MSQWPASPTFKVGDLVRVKHGVADVDYPDIPMGGWVGRISRIGSYSYRIRWSVETLENVHPVYRQRCEQDGIDIEEYWVNATDLELAPLEPLNMEQPTAIITDSLSADSQVDPPLFTLDCGIRCDCGANVDLAVGHQPTSENDRQVPQEATMYRTAKQRREEEIKLLAAIKSALPTLESLWKQANSHWGYEDPVYRFYHGSFKVYQLQGQTAEIVTALQDLAPHISLNHWFTRIVANGAAEQFSMEVNQRWSQATRPILEAFFHARYFLEMVCKYGRELNEPPDSLPSGWAAVLHLYDLR